MLSGSRRRSRRRSWRPWPRRGCPRCRRWRRRRGTPRETAAAGSPAAALPRRRRRPRPRLPRPTGPRSAAARRGPSAAAEVRPCLLRRRGRQQKQRRRAPPQQQQQRRPPWWRSASPSAARGSRACEVRGCGPWGLGRRRPRFLPLLRIGRLPLPPRTSASSRASLSRPPGPLPRRPELRKPANKATTKAPRGRRSPSGYAPTSARPPCPSRCASPPCGCWARLPGQRPGPSGRWRLLLGGEVEEGAVSSSLPTALLSSRLPRPRARGNEETKAELLRLLLPSLPRCPSRTRSPRRAPRWRISTATKERKNTRCEAAEAPLAARSCSGGANSEPVPPLLSLLLPRRSPPRTRSSSSTERPSCPLLLVPAAAPETGGRSRGWRRRRHPGGSASSRSSPPREKEEEERERRAPTMPGELSPRSPRSPSATRAPLFPPRSSRCRPRCCRGKRRRRRLPRRSCRRSSGESCSAERSPRGRRPPLASRGATRVFGSRVYFYKETKNEKRFSLSLFLSL